MYHNFEYQRIAKIHLLSSASGKCPSRDQNENRGPRNSPRKIWHCYTYDLSVLSMDNVTTQVSNSSVPDAGSVPLANGYGNTCALSLIQHLRPNGHFYIRFIEPIQQCILIVQFSIQPFLFSHVFSSFLSFILLDNHPLPLQCILLMSDIKNIFKVMLKWHLTIVWTK